jgi:ABC-2 type transport system permease protein
MNDIVLLVGRSLRDSARQPATVIPNIAISVFFLFVYNAGLSSVSGLPGFVGSYLGFILPVSLVSAAVGGAGLAGQLLIRDIQDGYFTKLLLTPTRRLAMIWGPMIASALILTAQVVLVMLLALAMGLQVASGALGFGLVVVLAFLWGMAFAGYAVLVALYTKNAAAAQAATFAFFPLIFLSYTFVPQEYVTAEWLRVAATINPTTYVFDAMRTLLNSGWETQPILIGFTVTLGFATLTGVAALWAARRATRLAS